MIDEPPLVPGAIVWVHLDPATGREQSGHRPAVVVAAREYLDIVDTLVVVVPVTSVNRGWPNHVQIAGGALESESWAMTEQIRTISRTRVVGTAGEVDPATLRQIRVWLRDFLDLSVD